MPPLYSNRQQPHHNVSGSASREDDFFCFEAQPAENTDARRTEVDMFLADTSRDIHCHLCRVAGNTVWSHTAREFP